MFMSDAKLSTEHDLTAQAAKPEQGSTAYVSISQAARLTGKSRTTIYAHEKARKFTFSKDHEGNTVVQVSDLMRVYGQLKLDKPEKVNVQNSPEQPRTKKPIEHNLTAKKGKNAQVDALRRLEAVQRQLTNEKALRETEKASVEARIVDLKENYEARIAEINDKTGAHIADLKNNLKTWQEQAKGSQLLLEHHSAKEATQKKGFFARLFGR